MTDTQGPTPGSSDVSDDLPLIDRAIELVNDRGSASGEMFRRALEISLVDAEMYLERLVDEGVLRPSDQTKGPRYLATGSRTRRREPRVGLTATSAGKTPSKTATGEQAQSSSESSSSQKPPSPPVPPSATIEPNVGGEGGGGGGKIQDVPLEKITIDPSIQPRTELDADAVDRYRAMYAAAESLPPLRLYRIKGRLVVAAGHHRLKAARRADLASLACEICDGQRSRG